MEKINRFNLVPTALWIGILLVLFSSSAYGDPFLQDSGASALVSIEAEHHHGSTIAPDGHKWTLVSEATYSRSGAMSPTPEDRVTWSTNYSISSPRLDYQVDFVSTGTHFIWIRGLGPSTSSDSLHVGLDGVEIPSAANIARFLPTRQLVWSNKDQYSGARVTLDVTTPGVHTVNVWMRESGMVVDKLVLTTDPSYLPSGSGPEESVFSGVPTLASPVISPNGGFFTDSILVTLSNSTPGANIYYTVDGSTPTTNSPLYASPFAVTSSLTVQAKAYLAGYNPSGTTSANFTVSSSQNQPPVLSPIGGRSVIEGQLLSFTVTAHDPDLSIPLLSASGMPAGAGFTDNHDGTATFTWIPLTGEALASPYTITFMATDAADATLVVSETIAISVNEPAWAGDPFLQDSGASALVSIEAEHYHGSTIAPDGHKWTLVSDAIYSRSGAMSPTPEDSVNWSTSYSISSPRLDYQVDFVSTGTHFIWIRGLGPSTSSDSLHVGLDGVEIPSAANIARFLPTRQLVWSNKDQYTGARVTLDVTTPGVHTVNVWMRESGMVVDKLVLTTDPSYLPSGSGPEESVFSGVPTLASPVISPNGGVFADSILVTLSNSTPVANIYYTVDGSTPTINSPLYASPFAVTSSLTVQAKAYLAGYNPSGITSANFTVSSSQNQPPVLTPIGDRSVIEGQLLSFTVTANDPDLSIPLLSASGMPAGAGFTDNHDGTATFTWIPLTGDALASPYNITFMATDAADATLVVNETIAISVNEPAWAGDPFLQDSGASALVSIEAEHYHGSTIAPDGHRWTLISGAIYSRSGAMSPTPEDSVNWSTSYSISSPRLDYQVDFVSTGTHFIWIRGLGPSTSSDSLHVGLDGVEIPSAANIARFLPTRQLVWSNKDQYSGARVTLDVTTPGVHTVNVWMRESGMVVDKLVLTTDPSYLPSGAGPEESVISGVPTLASPVISPNGGSFTDSILVTLSNSTPGANIYYTVDGSTPTINSPLYASPFAVTSSLTVQAKAYLAGYNPSGITSANFTVSSSQNQPPVLTPIGDRSVIEGQLLSLTVTANDPDLSIPLLSASGMPAGAGFTDNHDGTATFTWIPLTGDALASPYGITFMATDAADATLVVSETLAIFVTPPLPGVVWPTNGWSSATPTAMGLGQILLEQARDYALTGGGSGIITRGGRIVMSWGDITQRYDLKSATKSIGSIALGIAIKNNLATLGEKAGLFSAEFGTPPLTNLDTGWLAEISLQNLATQTAGFDKPGGYIDLLYQPGTAWAYSDGGVNWLADVLTELFGEDLNTLLFNQAFSAMGIGPSDLIWRDNASREDTIQGIKRREFSSGISANVDAMARIGYLFLRNGKWDEDQIVPQSFVQAVGSTPPEVVGLPVYNDTQARFDGASSHYGLLWWNNMDGALPSVPTDTYWAWGLGDSLIVVIPSLDIVISRAGSAWTGGRTPSYYSVLNPFIETIVKAVLKQLPITTDDEYNVVKNSTNIILYPLDNDSASNPEDTISIISVSTPDQGGSLIINETKDGIIYTPLENFYGIERFTYTIYDGTLTSSGEVVIHVLPGVQPYLEIISPQEENFQSSNIINIETTSSNINIGWGVRFALFDQFSGAIIYFDDYTYPFSAFFQNISKGTYTIQSFVIDDLGNEILSQNSSFIISNIHIGYYYIAIGDSLTRGSGDNYYSDNTSFDGRNTGGGYEPVLNDFLSAYNLLPHTVINKGVSGATSSYGRSIVQSMLTSYPDAEIFLIMYGTNDSKDLLVASGLGLSSGDAGYAGSYKDNMQKIVSAIVAAGKIPVMAKIPLLYGDCSTCTPYSDPLSEPRNALNEEYNMVIDQLVFENNSPINGPDLYSWSINNPLEFYNNLHPNGAGYRSIAYLWHLALRDLE